MSKLEFFVQGSAVEPYKVSFEKIGNNLNAYCTCAAGMNGQYCKHRFQLVSGNPEGLITKDEAMLRLLVDWMAGTDIEKALSKLALAEDEFERAKRTLANAKKDLAVAFRE
jgi:uncharacterized Zn finger protein